jgi:hypothetical protein
MRLNTRQAISREPPITVPVSPKWSLLRASNTNANYISLVTEVSYTILQHVALDTVHWCMRNARRADVPLKRP